MTSRPVCRRNSRKVLLLVGAAPGAFELAFFLGGYVLAAFFIVLVGLLLTFASFVIFAACIGVFVVGGAAMFGAVLGLAIGSPPVVLDLPLELELVPELELELALELVPEFVLVLAALLVTAFF